VLLMSLLIGLMFKLFTRDGLEVIIELQLLERRNAFQFDEFLHWMTTLELPVTV